MKRRCKIGLFCLISIFLNLGASLLIFDVLDIPLFFDTVFSRSIYDTAAYLLYNHIV